MQKKIKKKSKRKIQSSETLYTKNSETHAKDKLELPTFL